MSEASEKLTSEYQSPWKKPSALPKPAKWSLPMAAVLFLLACAAIPFSLTDETVAIISWSLLTAAGFFFTRNTKGLTGFLIVASVLGAVLPGVLLPLNTHYYPAIGAIVTAVCVGCCAGAYLQTVTRQFWVLPVLSAVAAVTAYLVTGDWLSAVMALAILPAVMLLAVATHAGESCTTAVCYTIGGLLVGLCGVLLLWVWRTYGALSSDLFRSLIGQWKEGFVQAQIASRGELVAMIEEQLALPDAPVERLEALRSNLLQVMSDQVIRQSMDALFQMLPAVLFLCCAIPAFLAQRLLNAAYGTSGMSAVITPESEFFTMSLPSAVIYTLSLFISMIPLKGIGFVSMVAGNLNLILLPGMLLIGLRYFKHQMTHSGRSSRRLIWGIVLLLLLLATSGMLQLGGLFGAYMRITQAVQRAIRKKMDGNNGSSS
ncbi:MAG: hypothetical protein IKC59_03875 [Clostridia bacterium]|nr:hypothetical protein [Clostridia bacterium]